MAAGPRISVMVVEDDDTLRREFASIIDAAPDLALLDVASDLSAGRAALARHGAPDVMIIDLGLPDGDGTALISELAAIAPKSDALVVTVFGDEGHVVRALEAGAKGYLLKDATPDEFVRAIRMVHEGGAPLSPMIARHVLKRFAPQRPARVTSPVNGNALVESLTARETEILKFIAQGKSVAETAVAFSLSSHTVTTHVKRIYGKLAVNNRVQAVNRARETGQID
ncbi:MAG: response regulator [Betaproteobacteria bacterium]